MLINTLFVAFLAFLQVISAFQGTFLSGRSLSGGVFTAAALYPGLVATVGAVQENDEFCVPHLACHDEMSWAFWNSLNVTCKADGTEGIYPLRFRDGVVKFNCTCARNSLCEVDGYENNPFGDNQAIFDREAPLLEDQDINAPASPSFRVGRSVSQITDGPFPTCGKCLPGTHCCFGECIIDTVVCSMPATMPMVSATPVDNTEIICTKKCPTGYFCCEDGCSKSGQICIHAKTSSSHGQSTFTSNDPQVTHGKAPGLAPALRDVSKPCCDISCPDHFDCPIESEKDDSHHGLAPGLAPALKRREATIPQLPIGTDLPTSGYFVAHDAAISTTTMMTTVELAPSTITGTSTVAAATTTDIIVPTTTFTELITGYVSEFGSSEYVVMSNAGVNTNPYESMVIELTLVDISSSAPNSTTTEFCTNSTTASNAAATGTVGITSSVDPTTVAMTSSAYNTTTTGFCTNSTTASNAAATGSDSITTTYPVTTTYCFDADMQTKYPCTDPTGTSNTGSAGGASGSNTSFAGVGAPVNSITVGHALSLSPGVSALLSLLVALLFL